MKLLPQRITNLSPYDYDQPSGGLRLDANESFIPLPAGLQFTVNAALAAVPLNRYPDPLAGGLCQAYGRYIGADPRYITAGNGSDELIGLLAGSFAVGKLLVVDPDFSMYRFYAGLNGVEVVAAVKNADYSVSPDAIKAAVARHDPAMVIFSNPCSPTGGAMPREDILQLADDRRIWIIDEAYMDFYGDSVADWAVEQPNIAVLRTCSKAWGLAGLRLGFAIAGEGLTGALRAAKSPYNVNALTQAAAQAVLSDRAYLKQSVQTITASRAALHDGLTALAGDCPGRIAVWPSVTNFVFVTCKEPEMCDKLHKRLAAQNIYIRKLDNALRITAGTDGENDELLRRMRQIMEEIV